ncbi:MAG: hypothetical protein WA133_10335 [Syntrophales bacterium]
MFAAPVHEGLVSGELLEAANIMEKRHGFIKTQVIAAHVKFLADFEDLTAYPQGVLFFQRQRACWMMRVFGGQYT